LRTLYTWLLYAALPWILARLWWRGRREPGYREALDERFGHGAFEPKPNLLWVHAVSVGEVRASAPLVRALRREHPDHDVLVTFLTAGGRETAKHVFGESVLSAYLPYDYPHAVRRFLEHYRPRLGVLVETEIWPNLMHACEQDGVPMLLHDATLQRTLELARAVLAADEARAWGLLQNPGRLRILTIDALNLSLSRRLPVLSGLGAGLGIEEDATELYALAAERLLEHLRARSQPCSRMSTTECRDSSRWWSRCSHGASRGYPCCRAGSTMHATRRSRATVSRRRGPR
jgi:hypothetical protein